MLASISNLMRLLLFSLIMVSTLLKAEPWIGTENIWLRSDIETLSNIGVIKIPTSTYPLMWSGIIKNLDETKIEEVPSDYKLVYWRVKKAGKQAVSGMPIKSLSMTAANSQQVNRSFGDSSREKLELTAKTSSMTKNWAWNFEVTHVSDPFDDDNVRLDNSYVSSVLGNWVVTAGKVEKWWGPTWFSNNLLSNNARPPVGISVQRNYSVQESQSLFNWVGPWTFTGFVSELDDSRAVPNTKLSGVSFSFKPIGSLEVGLRAATLFGGEGKPAGFPELIESLLGLGECDLPTEQDCDLIFGEGLYSSTGDRIAGFDLKWRLPIKVPLSVYYSGYGESESELIPSKSMQQFGVQGNFSLFDERWNWFVECSDTSLDRSDFNIAYESPVYLTGYRYLNRAIGSTFDSDSESVSLGVVGRLGIRNKF